MNRAVADSHDVNMSASAAGLCEFIDASPSPFHVCVTVAQRLLDAGYTELSEADRWPDQPGRYFTVRAGSLVAWNAAADHGAFRIVGAHTDSPNLRVKQHPDRLIAGWRVVALQPYGGVWLNSWLDRDLGISGRLSVRDSAGVTNQLVRIDDPILRIPQLAIHLADDRKSLTLDPQRHLNAVWGVGEGAGSFLGYVAERAGVAIADVLAADLMTHDLTPSRLIGASTTSLLSAPRLDNQASCYAGMQALLALEPASAPAQHRLDAARRPARAGALRPRGGRLDLGPRRAVQPADHRAGTHRARGRRQPGRLPATAAGFAAGLSGHGARHPPQLPGAA